MEFNIVDSTCTTEGIKTTNCLCGCGYTFSEKIPVLDEHPYTKTIIEPTCTSRGYEKYVCSSCGDTYTINYTPMLEHDYKDVFTVEPTCVSSGTKNIICSTCGYCKSSNVYVPSLGHIDENKDLYCDRENCKEAIESEPFTEGIYTYTVKAGAATIKAVDNTISGDVVIPSTLGGYPVVAIGDEAFIECYYLTSVTIPETVTAIGEACFAYCIALKEVVISENVLTIGEDSFAYCMSLEKLIIKNSETAFGEFVAYTEMTVADGYTIEEWIEKFYALRDAENNGTADDSMYDDILAITVMHDEPVALPTVTIYSYDPSTAKTYAEGNGIPFKNISELEEPHTCSFGEWFTETEPTVFSEGVSKRVCECGEFETKPIAKLESASTKDETTKVEITYTEENFESEVEIVVSEEEINANIVFGDEFESYKAYDISLEADGEKIQPKGYVTVKLPIPEGFNADSTVVYYVDDSGNKTKLESTTENGYIVFETDHFSEYVLVDESSRIEPPHVHSYTASITKEATCTENGTTTYICSCGDSYNETIEATGHDFDGSKCKNCDYDKADTCGCNCHKGGFMGFIWKIINFFNKLFKSKQCCACGAKHW